MTKVTQLVGQMGVLNMSMKKSILTAWVAMGCLAGACGYGKENRSEQQGLGTSSAESDTGRIYDDARIRGIRRLETTESQLIQWFGSPESRTVDSDGRMQLSWAFSSGTTNSPGGSLNVLLQPDAKVESYSTRRLPDEETRTVEFTAQSENDMRARMEQWRREGWNVHSVSEPTRQSDGTTKRKADLSRRTNKFLTNYDDKAVAAIQRATTTEVELVQSFGPAYSREMTKDGKAQLVWKFGDWTKPGTGTSGELTVRLAPDGKVDSYAARRGP